MATPTVKVHVTCENTRAAEGGREQCVPTEAHGLRSGGQPEHEGVHVRANGRIAWCCGLFILLSGRVVSGERPAILVIGQGGFTTSQR